MNYHRVDLKNYRIRVGLTGKNIMCYPPNTRIVVADPSGFHMLVSQGRGQLDKETPSVRTRSKGTATHQSVAYNILTEYQYSVSVWQGDHTAP